MLKQAWCNKQDLITQPGNCNDSHRSVCKHLQTDEGECKYHDSSIIQQHKGTHTCAHTADLQQNGQTKCPLNQIYVEINRHPLQFSFQWLSVCQKHRLVTGGSEVRWVTYGCFVLFICAYQEIHMLLWEIIACVTQEGMQKKRQNSSFEFSVLLDADSWTTIMLQHRRCLQTEHQQDLQFHYVRASTFINIHFILQGLTVSVVESCWRLTNRSDSIFKRRVKISSRFRW